MLAKYPCRDCKIEFQINLDRCPHCARPGLFPNVRLAEEESERAELLKRYEESYREADTRGALAAVATFEQRVKAEAKAVLARTANELQRLATSDNEVYASFYKLLDAQVRLWEPVKWSVLRGAMDQALFPGFHAEVRFAALSLDHLGLSNYGDCSITLRTELISHRASLFEENSVMFMLRSRRLFEELAALPLGYRATWDERARLCVVKLARLLEPGAPRDAHVSLLLKQGNTTESDQFVEVHVWGPLTAHCFEQVAFKPGTERASRATIRSINLRRLRRIGVKIV